MSYKNLHSMKSDIIVDNIDPHVAQMRNEASMSPTFLNLHNMSRVVPNSSLLSQNLKSPKFKGHHDAKSQIAGKSSKSIEPNLQRTVQTANKAERLKKSKQSKSSNHISGFGIGGPSSGMRFKLRDLRQGDYTTKRPQKSRRSSRMGSQKRVSTAYGNEFDRNWASCSPRNNGISDIPLTITNNGKVVKYMKLGELESRQGPRERPGATDGASLQAGADINDQMVERGVTNRTLVAESSIMESPREGHRKHGDDWWVKNFVTANGFYPNKENRAKNLNAVGDQGCTDLTSTTGATSVCKPTRDGRCPWFTKLSLADDVSEDTAGINFLPSLDSRASKRHKKKTFKAVRQLQKPQIGNVRQSCDIKYPSTYSKRIAALKKPQTPSTLQSNPSTNSTTTTTTSNIASTDGFSKLQPKGSKKESFRIKTNSGSNSSTSNYSSDMYTRKIGNLSTQAEYYCTNISFRDFKHSNRLTTGGAAATTTTAKRATNKAAQSNCGNLEPHYGSRTPDSSSHHHHRSGGGSGIQEEDDDEIGVIGHMG